jgi:hypothetical protein
MYYILCTYFCPPCSTIIQNIFTFTVTQSTLFSRRRDINHLETYPLIFRQWTVESQGSMTRDTTPDLIYDRKPLPALYIVYIRPFDFILYSSILLHSLLLYCQIFSLLRTHRIIFYCNSHNILTHSYSYPLTVVNILGSQNVHCNLMYLN